MPGPYNHKLHFPGLPAVAPTPPRELTPAQPAREPRPGNDLRDSPAPTKDSNLFLYTPVRGGLTPMANPQVHGSIPGLVGYTTTSGYTTWNPTRPNLFNNDQIYYTFNYSAAVDLDRGWPLDPKTLLFPTGWHTPVIPTENDWPPFAIHTWSNETFPEHDLQSWLGDNLQRTPHILDNPLSAFEQTDYLFLPLRLRQKDSLHDYTRDSLDADHSEFDWRTIAIGRQGSEQALYHPRSTVAPLIRLRFLAWDRTANARINTTPAGELWFRLAPIYIDPAQIGRQLVLGRTGGIDNVSSPIVTGEATYSTGKLQIKYQFVSVVFEPSLSRIPPKNDYLIEISAWNCWGWTQEIITIPGSADIPPGEPGDPGAPATPPKWTSGRPGRPAMPALDLWARRVNRSTFPQDDTVISWLRPGTPELRIDQWWEALANPAIQLGRWVTETVPGDHTETGVIVDIVTGQDRQQVQFRTISRIYLPSNVVPVDKSGIPANAEVVEEQAPLVPELVNIRRRY